MPKFSFENHISGHLFRWLIASGQIEWAGMIDRALRNEADRDKAIKRFAKAIKHAVEEHSSWSAEAELLSEHMPSGISCPVEDIGSLAGAPAEETGPSSAPTGRPIAPTYGIWFRPSPSRKISFEEVAKALLEYAGRLPARASE